MSNPTPGSRPAGAARRWVRRIEHVLFSRRAAAVAVCLTASIFFGCLSGSSTYHHVEERARADEGEVFLAEGKLTFRAGTEQIVYYPAPYSSPPNLEMNDPAQLCDLVEQKENCFRV